MLRVFCLLAVALALSGCAAVAVTLATSMATGVAAGYAAQVIVREERREQPVVVTGGGKVLAMPAAAEGATKRIIAADAQECRVRITPLKPVSGTRTLKFPMSCSNGRSALVLVALNPLGPVNNDFTAVFPIAEDRDVICTGVFRFSGEVIEPFGLSCKETYRAPCSREPARPASRDCKGDFDAALKLRLNPARSDGAVAIRRSAPDVDTVTVWINRPARKG